MKGRGERTGGVKNRKGRLVKRFQRGYCDKEGMSGVTDGLSPAAGLWEESLGPGNTTFLSRHLKAWLRSHRSHL